MTTLLFKSKSEKMFVADGIYMEEKDDKIENKPAVSYNLHNDHSFSLTHSFCSLRANK